MYISLRAALLAGALYISGTAVRAEPVSLIDALAQGAEQSPRISQAKALAEAAEARARQAGVGPNPELGVEVENFAGTGAFQGLRSTETTLALSQRLELGGKRSARVAVAKAERDFAVLAFARAQFDLARDVRVAHAELKAAEDRALLARDNVGRAQELARTAGLLVDAGRDPPLRKLRADALLAEAQAEQTRSFADMLAARRLLASLIGSNDPELSAGDASDQQPPAEMAHDVSGLDERLSEAERDAARARIKLAQATAVPDVTASAGVRRFADGKETAFVAGFSIPLPFRDRNRGGIAAAQSDSLASEANLAQTRLDTKRARHDAQYAFDAAQMRVEALSGAGAAQAEEALRIARAGYAAGKFSLVELIDAQQAYNSAKLLLIEARLDRARAAAALIRANAQ
jgi:outer membrane protein, heavy metal efflux system